MRAPRAPLLVCAAAWIAPLACQGVDFTPEPQPITEESRAFSARRALQDARMLRAQGRLESAAGYLERGIQVSPDDPRLHHELARVLEALGRDEAARSARQRADALDPPPPPPPDQPLPGTMAGLLVALVPLETDAAEPERAASDWPLGEVASVLEERLHTRLPGARISHADPATLAEARAWLRARAPRAVLSLGVERAFCGDTIKDGPFAVAWLRVAAAAGGEPLVRAETLREVVLEPRLAGGCRREALARGLETLLDRPSLKRALRESGGAPGRWSSQALRELFPGLGRRLARELALGHERLAAGRVGEAAEAFRRALEIDPDDRDAHAYLAEAEASLALVGELQRARGPATSQGSGGGAPGPLVLAPQLSDDQRGAVERQLAEEQRRRIELLATLAVLDQDVVLPPPSALDTLRTASIRDPEAPGPRLARDAAAGPIEAKSVFAPDGSVLARYYLPRGGDLPILREEDTDGDGRPDRWVRYSERTRREVWEDGNGSGEPDLRVVFADDGQTLVRIELDADADGRPERIFYYEDGRLTAENRDTNRNGRFDRFERFDAEGNVAVREEDLNGDGEVDVRSVYRLGKLVRREITHPGIGTHAP